MSLNITTPVSQDLPYKDGTHVLNLSLVVLGLIYMISVYAFTIPARMQVFNKTFMEQFQPEHEAAFPGRKVSRLGLPDTGNGYYSKQLSYREWYQINNARRVQYNFLEQITFFAVLTIVAGVTKPIVACVFAFMYSVGRLCFAVGYTFKGPQWRIPGALLIDLAIFGQIGLGIYAIVMQLQS